MSQKFLPTQFFRYVRDGEKDGTVCIIETGEIIDGKIEVYEATALKVESIMVDISKLVPACNFCNITNSNLQLCGGCRTAHNCNQACQKHDRHIHRLFCVPDLSNLA